MIPIWVGLGALMLLSKPNRVSGPALPFQKKKTTGRPKTRHQFLREDPDEVVFDEDDIEEGSMEALAEDAPASSKDRRKVLRREKPTSRTEANESKGSFAPPKPEEIAAFAFAKAVDNKEDVKAAREKAKSVYQGLGGADQTFLGRIETWTEDA